jgi:hypothetical protein
MDTIWQSATAGKPSPADNTQRRTVPATAPDE